MEGESLPDSWVKFTQFQNVYFLITLNFLLGYEQIVYIEQVIFSARVGGGVRCIRCAVKGGFVGKIMSGSPEPGGTGTSGDAENKTQGNEESSR